MKHSVVLVILVSIIVWAIFWNLLPWVFPEGPFTTLILTVLLAIAGGLLARAILQTIGIAGAGIHLMGAVIGSILLLFIVAKVAQLFVDPAFRSGDKNATVTCLPDKVVFTSQETDKNKNKVKEGKNLTWHITGMANTAVKFEFIQKLPCKGESPFKVAHIDPTIPAGGYVSSGGTINSGKRKNCYSYKITCTRPGGPPGWLDPIIEVPKRK